MQAISDANVELLAQIGTDEVLAALLAEVFEDATRDDFAPGEYIQLVASMQAFVRQLENTYLQNREGIVPDEVFETYMWRDPLFRTAFFVEWWESLSERMVSPEFNAFFESQVQIDP